VEFKMKQVFINSSQVVEVREVDIPECGPREALVAVKASLISTGTETAGYDSGGLVSRSLRNPSVIRTVMQSMEREGISATFRKIQVKRKELTPRGYSGAGLVVKVGREVRGLSVGDRVAYAGAPHAEYVAVGEHLVAPIPEGIPFAEAAFGAVACIALHGVRLAEPTLGETALILGLGLVGMLTAQFARACGLEILCLETNPARRDLAAKMGFSHVMDPSGDENLPQTISFFTKGTGADIAYLCAATRDSAVTNEALASCRDRGRVIMIGDMGLELSRAPLFRKELVFRVSRSYGPGRYDEKYEAKGLDYPIGYVRWSEQRNLAFFLEALSQKRVRVDSMISTEVPVENAPDGYRMLVDTKGETLAVVLAYPDRKPEAPAPSPVLRRTARKAGDPTLRIGVIGCGAFAQGNLLPHFHKLGARLYGVANRTSRAFPAIQALYSPEMLATSAEALIDDENVDAFIVATRHDLHATFARAILRKGKPVHVEKPLAMTPEEAREIAELVRETGGLLTIGFNRRFAPAIVALRALLTESPRPCQFLYRVNAQVLPADHWVRDSEEGGGRLIGEGCHFIDLICYLAGSAVVGVSGGMLGSNSPASMACDNFSMTLKFENGDLGTLSYSGQGNAEFGKERIEVFAGGRVFMIEDFSSLAAYGVRQPNMKWQRPDKGISAHLENFFDAVRGKGNLVTTADDGVKVAEIIARFVAGKGNAWIDDR
jgi:predicted dehydrogenase/threonine dehydrogenase-like Zn-dependent dehydrogenase